MHLEYVRLGSIVVVLTADGDQETYTVVAARDANPRESRVSSESPIGRALLGRRVGERVVIPAPGRSFAVTIESVEPPRVEEQP